VLAAAFRKSFRRGPTIHASLVEPLSPPGITALLGPSGGGKTTILRCLAGLEHPDEGTIALGDATWFDAARRIHVPPERRGVGFLFQDYALFPHMTVEENVLFALNETSPAARARVHDLLARFQVAGLQRRYPRELSGGQQQRVALARAIGAKPSLLLLDEPLAALDAPTREEIRQPLKHALADLRVPVIVVTHDRLDALALASRVLVVESGRVVQGGATADVFAAPATASVARLVGVETIVGGRVATTESGVSVVRVGTTTVHAAGVADAGADVDLCIRGEDVTLFGVEPAAASAQNLWRGTVESIIDAGGVWRVRLDCGFLLTALVTRAAGASLGIVEGRPVWAAVKATAVTVLSR
jgi:molybdate transport system ATP-binding protein